MRERLELIYQKLYSHYGPQHWWPGDSPFEVMVGAILTQNTNWSNVEKAINNLKKNKLLAPKKLYCLPAKKLARFIRPSGYYNIKAKRLKEFLNFFLKAYKGNLKNLRLKDTQGLRQELLKVNGIGPETADSILLYALNKPIFVVDAYTKRILRRHRLIPESADYNAIQNLFMQNLKNPAFSTIKNSCKIRKGGVKLFNEYHALLVRLGKEYCLKNKPRCHICPLRY